METIIKIGRTVVTVMARERVEVDDTNVTPEGRLARELLKKAGFQSIRDRGEDGVSFTLDSKIVDPKAVTKSLSIACSGGETYTICRNTVVKFATKGDIRVTMVSDKDPNYSKR